MTRAARAFLVLLPVALAPCLAEAGITVWRDKDQRGPSQRVDGAVPDLRRIGFDDQISSLAAEEPWLVCSEPRYRGECREIDGTVENLHGSGMNDRISSLRPVSQGRGPDAEGYGRGRGRGRGRGGYGSSDDAPAARIRVYVNEDFRGDSRTFDRAVPNLADFGLARQITSVRIDGGTWEVCSRAGYGGRCVVLRGNSDDLGDWSDAIVSLRPVSGGRPAEDDQGSWDDNRGGSGTRIRVYTDEQFQGRSETFERDVPDLSRFGMAGQVTSVRIEGGPWEICTETRFRGECKVIRDSDGFLGWWSDNIGSLRPAREEDR